MTGFEPRTSGVGSDRFVNWATTTAHCKWEFAFRMISDSSITYADNTYLLHK